MPTLDWIGKRAVVNHHRELPYRLLHRDRDLSAGDADSGNLLVEGDNLHALKALLPYYAGRVKCIYIDPPYNTGNEGWVYNDNVNAPEIQKWLGDTVGKEAEDLSRHEKWLCMMYPRLALLREFLREDGVIFISIGKDEIGHLRVMCDEIFGRLNLLETFIWVNEGNVENAEAITAVHDYILAYGRKADRASIRTTIDPNVDDDSKLLRDFAENSVIKNGPANPPSVILLPTGFPCQADSLQLAQHSNSEDIVRYADQHGYLPRDAKAQFGVEYPIRLDDLVVEEGQLTQPCRVYSGWSSARKFRAFIDGNLTPLAEDDGSRVRYFLSANGVPYYRRDGRKGHFVPTVLRNMGSTEKDSNMLERMGIDFDYPKPMRLVRYLLDLVCDPGELVLDAFGGSGTTGHAALLPPQRDLRFLLIELDHDNALRIQQRLSKVISGYVEQRKNKKVAIAGLGGGFRFCTFGDPLLDAEARFHPNVKWSDLGHHLWFAETGEPWSVERASGAAAQSLATGGPMLGVAPDGRAIYLLHSPRLGGENGHTSNVLTPEMLALLAPHAGPRVVYGEACTLRASALSREGVVFKQIPYQVRQQ